MADYYTTDQVAKFCKVSRSSLIRWIHEGKLDASVTAGGHHRILKSDVLKLLTLLRIPHPEEKSEACPVALVVDDEPGFRQLLRAFLRDRFPQFQVEEAIDGFEAGLKVQRFRPELMLLDIILPGQSGFSVCRQIRSTPEFSSMAIIAISGMPDEETRRQILEIGVSDFLPKPFELNVLESKIRQHLGKEARSSREVQDGLDSQASRVV